MDFPYVVYWVSSVVQNRQDIENGFLSLLRGSKMKCFLSKIWHLKFSFLSFAVLPKKSKK